MKGITLHPECNRCAALCCLALSFDKSESFAFSKEAGTPCAHLERTRCAIHANLKEQGFSGCIRYDCLGAGQRVIQEVFAGRSWQDDPALIVPMMAAFSSMRLVHENLQLLEAAGALSLSPSREKTRRALLRALMPANGWTPRSLAAFERSGLPGRLEAFFLSLRETVVEGTC